MNVKVFRTVLTTRQIDKFNIPLKENHAHKKSVQPKHIRRPAGFDILSNKLYKTVEHWKPNTGREKDNEKVSNDSASKHSLDPVYRNTEVKYFN